MDRKLLIIQVAALAHKFEFDGLKSGSTQSVFPAVTCTVQASFRTASLPSTHGVIANGFFSRTLSRPMFWEQSARLVQGERIWKNFRKRGKRVGMLFWQQSLGEDVDISLSPAPIHKHHGGMIQGCYSRPADLYDKLCKHIGRPFKLQQYWGPRASWKVGEWIVAATSAMLEDHELAPDLCFTYLPTLDYDLQRSNPDNSTALSKVIEQISKLIRLAKAQGYDVFIFGDYQIAPVSGAVLPNLALRNAGLMQVRVAKGMMYPDFYGSYAFAVADHEIAHIYISNKSAIPAVQRVFEALPGIGDILDREAQAQVGLNHENSGELVIIAEPGKWLAYPWWTKKRDAPEFAGHVDIHNKPGYDPCELFFGWPPGSVSQNTDRIKGSHGRIGPDREVTWASTLPVQDYSANLIELSAAIGRWLDGGIL